MGSVATAITAIAERYMFAGTMRIRKSALMHDQHRFTGPAHRSILLQGLLQIFHRLKLHKAPAWLLRVPVLDDVTGHHLHQCPALMQSTGRRLTYTHQDMLKVEAAERADILTANSG